MSQVGEKSLERDIPVIVTGAGGGGHGEQIVKALRLSNLPYKITTSDISEVSTAGSIGDNFKVLPRATDPGYLDSLMALVKETGAEVVFHGSEPEMMVMAKNADKFHEIGVYLPVNPESVMNICQDKSLTSQFLFDQGFYFPQYRKVQFSEELESFDHLPAVLKPSVGGGGSSMVFIVQDKKELLMVGEYLLSIFDEIAAQEYVGTPEQEYTVGVLSTKNRTVLGSIAIKRFMGNALSVQQKVPNRSGKEELGETLVISSGISQGSIEERPNITGYCEEIAKRLGATAPINIQCRVVGDKVVPFEINPRFSGTTSLRAMVGYNEPDTLIRREIFKEDIPLVKGCEGMVLRKLEEVRVR